MISEGFAMIIGTFPQYNAASPMIIGEAPIVMGASAKIIRTLPKISKAFAVIIGELAKIDETSAPIIAILPKYSDASGKIIGKLPQYSDASPKIIGASTFQDVSFSKIAAFVFEPDLNSLGAKNETGRAERPNERERVSQNVEVSGRRGDLYGGRHPELSVSREAGHVREGANVCRAW